MEGENCGPLKCSEKIISRKCLKINELRENRLINYFHINCVCFWHQFEFSSFVLRTRNKQKKKKKKLTTLSRCALFRRFFFSRFQANEKNKAERILFAFFIIFSVVSTHPRPFVFKLKSVCDRIWYNIGAAPFQCLNFYCRIICDRNTNRSTDAAHTRPHNHQRKLKMDAPSQHGPYTA